MAEQTVKSPAPTDARTAIVCRLRRPVGRRESSPTAGEVEIENVSPDAIEIQVAMHPLQYLDLLIRDAAGAFVPAAPYGHLFSPRETPYVLRLAPGEKYTHNVSLLGTVPEAEQLPGTYSVQAVYEYNGMKAISASLTVELPVPSSQNGPGRG
jgi:hypothetical protein